ncbi:PIN domain-containing protein [Bradyrhizobium sp. SSUT18]|uniref:PIN domain-containing protein n=1 Tax=unclassified Bradyrhizobium TaxID=2631580 RepID=UPI002447776E|nr:MULTISPECIES: PIN domain-containing protein [unclassified Bradyrhizobium]MDH2356261.1 PIN domain-containing protein [Bradyrhizobium sp. SSUT112]MDH2404478.1 PIN domain-containing protein [Bradyrhizobium sp. SSUT18]
MRRPSTTIVIDAAILIAAVRGRSSGALLKAAEIAILVTTDRVVQEARRRIALGLRRPELIELLDALAELLTIVPVAALEPMLARCEETLRDAVASRNGSERDAHVLALAWSVEADVWTTDRDFAGTGVATWSTPNLMRAFADSGAKPA